MTNNSSTGGYIAPINTGGEQNDEALRIFLQQLVVGVTGMDGTKIFPRWQEEEPLRPAVEVDWAAVGVQRRIPDKFAYVAHEPAGDGDDVLYRNELLEILCSFYGPNCENNAELFSVGLQISQNREVLQLAGYGVVEVEDLVTAADFLHNKWVTRVDAPFCLRRAQGYRYPVLNVVSAEIVTKSDTSGANNSITVSSSSNVPQLPLFGWGLQSGLVQGWGLGNWR